MYHTVSETRASIQKSKISERQSGKFPDRPINTNSFSREYIVYVHILHALSASTLCGVESQPVTKLPREAALIPPTFLLEMACHTPRHLSSPYAFREFRQLSLRHHLCMFTGLRVVASSLRAATKLDFNEAKPPNMVPAPHIIPIDIYALYAMPAI